MKKGDIVLTKTHSYFGKVISKYTNSYWTHVNVMRNEKDTFEFTINRKKLMSLEQLFKDEEILEYKILENALSPQEVEAVEETFRTGIYENINGLYRIMRNVQNGRTKSDIRSSPYSLTCCSLIGENIQDNFLLDFHYSQMIPDDFEKYK